MRSTVIRHLVGIFAVLLFYQNCSQGIQIIQLDSSSLSVSLQSEEKKAMALLATNCNSCHGDRVAEGNVKQIVDVNHLISTKLIVPGEPLQSRLLDVVEENRMPPDRSLRLEDKRTLANWILLLGGKRPVDPSSPDYYMFDLNVSSDPLSFRTRLAKIETLVGASASLAKLKENRYLLGDHDFSKSVLPKIAWESGDMKVWLDSISPVCASTELQTKFAWPAKTTAFVQAAYGRAPVASDTALIQEIQAVAGATDKEKLEIFCMTLLSSMEFIAK